MHLVRTGSALGIEGLVKELGGNPIAVLESVGLRQSQFRDPDTYIAYHKLAELLQAGAAACDAPLFGLLLVQRQPLAVLGDLPMIAARAATVKEALEVSNRFLYLHASGVQVQTLIRRDRAQVRLEIHIGRPPGIDQLMQLSVGHVALFAAGMLNSDRFSLSLHLKQPAPPEAISSGNLRFHNLHFDAAFDGISLPAESLDYRNHQDEEALNEHLQQYLDNLKARYPDRLENQVAEVIGRILPAGECAVERVAATLDVNPRTLQARLQAAGTSYREILQQTRQNLAMQHLSSDTTSVTDLALQLGYAEVAVFSRHFKRWTGLSPRAWRETHQQEKSGRA